MDKEECLHVIFLCSYSKDFFEKKNSQQEVN